MIIIRHRARGPSGGAVWTQDELRGPDLVFVRSRYEGAQRDETFCPETAEGCSSIRFVLGGPMVVRAGVGTADLRQGQLYASATHGTAAARALTPKTDLLVIGWRRGTGAGGTIAHDVRLGPSPLTTARLHRLADALADVDATRSCVCTAADDVIAALRAEGFPFLPTASLSDLRNDTPEQRLAEAVEQSLAPLSSQPSSVDLSRALGVGEHHALRRTNEHFRQFYFSVRGWREYLRRRRIDLGAFFMGRPDARTEDVARALGFRSPTSFCHAFQAAGLPSPRAVQHHLLAS